MFRFVFGAITAFGVVVADEACDVKNDEQVAMLQTKDRVSLAAEGSFAVAQLFERAARDLKATSSDDMLHLVDAFTKRLKSTAEAIPENEADALLQRASQGKEMRLLAQSWRDLPDELKTNFIEAVGESAEVADALSTMHNSHKLAFLQQLHSTTEKAVLGKPRTTTEKTARGKKTVTVDPATGYRYVYEWTPTSSSTSTTGKRGSGYSHSHNYQYNPNTGGSATQTATTGGGHSHQTSHSYNGAGTTNTNTVSNGGGHTASHSHSNTPSGSATNTFSNGGGNTYQHQHLHNTNTGKSFSKTVSNGAVTSVGR